MLFKCSFMLCLMLHAAWHGHRRQCFQLLSQHRCYVCLLVTRENVRQLLSKVVRIVYMVHDLLVKFATLVFAGLYRFRAFFLCLVSFWVFLRRITWLFGLALVIVAFFESFDETFLVLAYEKLEKVVFAHVACKLAHFAPIFVALYMISNHRGRGIVKTELKVNILHSHS